MLDDIIEIILEIFFDIALQTFDNKKVPKFVRVFSAIVILVVLLGASGLLIGAGINTGESILILLGVGLLVGFAVFVVYRVIKHKKRRKIDIENKENIYLSTERNKNDEV